MATTRTKRTATTGATPRASAGAKARPIGTTRTIEGSLVAPGGARFAIVASRFNHFVVDRLVEGAHDALGRHGVAPGNVAVVRVPGAWELPIVARRLAASGKVDAVIALGAVIRGATAHFEYVAGEAAKGLASAAHASPVPIIFGVLTTESIEQAIERAGTKSGNKGSDAAVSAIEMVSLSRALDDAGL
jgi:6,7-dimethyl-8-ribityllumazine synthase